MHIYMGNISLQGDTLQNVAHQLDEIYETGHYLFKLPIDGEAELSLKYTPSAHQTSSIEWSTESETGSTSGVSIMTSGERKSNDLVVDSGGESPIVEQWSSEQIGDFVRKLGFMDSEKERGKKIKNFRYISTVSFIAFE